LSGWGNVPGRGNVYGGNMPRGNVRIPASVSASYANVHSNKTDKIKP